jgi:hypothetical protein
VKVKNMKESSYYVLKYGDQYYCPYLTKDYASMDKIANITTHDRRLAVRFPTREVAEFFLQIDAECRSFNREEGFRRELARVVKIVAKKVG